MQDHLDERQKQLIIHRPSGSLPEVDTMMQVPLRRLRSHDGCVLTILAAYDMIRSADHGCDC